MGFKYCEKCKGKYRQQSFKRHKCINFDNNVLSTSDVVILEKSELKEVRKTDFELKTGTFFKELNETLQHDNPKSEGSEEIEINMNTDMESDSKTGRGPLTGTGKTLQCKKAGCKIYYKSSELHRCINEESGIHDTEIEDGDKANSELLKILY